MDDVQSFGLSSPDDVFGHPSVPCQIRGDWRVLPTSSWDSLYSRFAGLNGNEQIISETADEGDDEETLSSVPRLALRSAWYHLRQYGPSAQLPTSTTNDLRDKGILADEVERLRQALRYSIRQKFLRVCKYSYQLEPSRGSIDAASLPAALR